MTEEQKNLINELKDKINTIDFSINCFQVELKDGKYIFGVLTPIGKENNISRISEYSTLYKTLQDIDWKIKHSLNKAIEYSFLDSVLNNYNPFLERSNEEKLAYYYIENALYRISTAWDLLAQFYRLFYSIPVEADKVYCNKIFNPNSSNAIEFKEDANRIYGYLNEEEDKHDLSKGTHKYVNKIRNKMTHRNAPSVSAISNFDKNLRMPPCYMLARVIDDYKMAGGFLDNIIKRVKESL